MIQIQIWVDFECPYSYFQALTLNHLQAAYPNRIEVLGRAIELSPNKLSAAPSQKYIDQLQIAHQEPIVQTHQLRLEIPKQLGDTWLAQESICFANQHQLALPFMIAVFEAFFAHGIDITNEAEILKIAEAVGLDPDKLLEALNSGVLTKQVILDVEEFTVCHFQGVPAMLFGEKNFSPRSFSPVYGYKPLNDLIQLIPSNLLNHI